MQIVIQVKNSDQNGLLLNATVELQEVPRKGEFIWLSVGEARDETVCGRVDQVRWSCRLTPDDNGVFQAAMISLECTAIEPEEYDSAVSVA